MRKFIILAFFCFVAFGQTTVRQTAANPLRDAAQNVVAAGQILITPNQRFTTSGGIPVYPITITVPVTNGAFSVALYPNDATSDPSTGTSYTARYSIRGAQIPTETWVVPTSGSPIELASVRTSPTPIPTYTINLSQLQQGGATNGQVLAWNGTTYAPSSAGSGTVTHTPGALTLNSLICGNGTGDLKTCDLSGNVTTSGSGVTTIAAAAVTNPMLAGSIAAAKLIGSDIATLGTITAGVWHGTPIDVASYISGVLPCADHPALTGDVTNSAASCATTVVKINGVTLSGLATGIVKNTTGTGAPSIAVAGDFPTLNQNTSGTAATITGLVALANTQLTMRGDLLVASTATPVLARLAKGTQYQTLQGGAADLGWDAVHLDQASAITGVLPNASTTAVSTNTASAIVLRDGSGNFAAGTITATNLTTTGQLTGTSFFCNGVSTKTSNYTATGADCTIRADTTGGNIGITLPASPVNGQIINVKKIAAANTLTILGNGLNIDGSASIPITTNNQNTKVQYDSASTTWNIL